MKKLTLASFLFLFSFRIYSVVKIAVFDTGIDYQHEIIAPHYLINKLEKFGIKGWDDDHNGLEDDIWGWNFDANNSNIFPYIKKDVLPLNQDIIKLYQLSAKKAHGEIITPEELNWEQEAYKNESLIKKIDYFSYFSHGTSVAGEILRSGNLNIKVVSESFIIPTQKGVPLDYEMVTQNNEYPEITQRAQRVKKFSELLNTAFLKYENIFLKMASYAKSRGVVIVNGSYGRDVVSISGWLRKPILDQFIKADSTTDEYLFVANEYIKLINEISKKMVTENSDILFIFSSGNSGTSLDERRATNDLNYLPNVILVGALNYFETDLAKFSSYSPTKVDLAAKGQAIETICCEGNIGIPMSGTSLAAPQVTRYAANLKNRFPFLSASDLKKIILGKVIKMDTLRDKLLTSGKLNEYEFKNQKEVRKFLKQMPLKSSNQVENKDFKNNDSKQIENNPEWRLIQ